LISTYIAVLESLKQESERDQSLSTPYPAAGRCLQIDLPEHVARLMLAESYSS
jgi:hypothetical protein